MGDKDFPADIHEVDMMMAGAQVPSDPGISNMLTVNGNCRCGQVRDALGVMPHKPGVPDCKFNITVLAGAMADELTNSIPLHPTPFRSQASVEYKRDYSPQVVRYAQTLADLVSSALNTSVAVDYEFAAHMMKERRENAEDATFENEFTMNSRPTRDDWFGF